MITRRWTVLSSLYENANRVAVYRGHWCPFCISHIRSLKPIEKQIHDAGGHTVIITSEIEDHLLKVRKATGYTGPAIVDPHNTLVKELKERDVANVAISDMRVRGYKHGMAQPAVFVMQQDGTVLYSWAIVPRLVSEKPGLKFHERRILMDAPRLDEFGRCKGQAIAQGDLGECGRETEWQGARAPGLLDSRNSLGAE